MAFDFVLLSGIENQPGDAYLYTPVLHVTNMETSFIFKKIYEGKEIHNCKVMPEIEVDKFSPIIYAKAFERYSKDRITHFLIREKDNVQILKVQQLDGVQTFSSPELGKIETKDAETIGLCKILERFY